MSRLMKVIGRWGGMVVTSLALLIGMASVNVACVLWYHQPKIPNGMENFKRH